MKVKKRNGSLEEVNFEKISNRVKRQTFNLNNKYVDYSEISIQVIAGLYDGVSSHELDILAAEICASKVTTHPDYSFLASRILITDLYKNFYGKRSKLMLFSENIERLYLYVDQKTQQNASLIHEETYKIIQKNADYFNHLVIHERDLNIDYFGFKTLEKSYLLKINAEISETPQFMYLRVAIGIWGDNLEKVKDTYDMLSNGYMTHATPTLFNSGTRKNQLSSCFLLDIDDDSINGIYKTLADCAKISQLAGGIGINIHKIRAKGTYIKGTNGTSNGIIPMLKVFNETARYVDQGGGKRKGSMAIYIEPWHKDIFDFLNLRKNQGKEELRTRDLFLGLWIPNLFMERVKSKGKWTLFCPTEAPNLLKVYDEKDDKQFTKAYEQYEKEGRGKTINAMDLWEKILVSQIETGVPYMLYKDSINQKSNQKNIGLIKSSNLCTEIVEYTDKNEIAVCNLASISLKRFLSKDRKNKKDITFDYKKLYEVTYKTIFSLNKVVDINFYALEETKYSNLKHRPVGLGIQGLADVYCIMGLPFCSEKSKELNRNIFETMYFAALTASKDLAVKQGKYETFDGSPLSKGIFQFDMWDADPKNFSGLWDWDALRKEIMKHGVRNSLLIAPMPTASTSQILGNNECFEPFTANIYKRNTLSGEHVLINKYLVEDLINLGLWNSNLKNKIIINDGSIANIKEIPDSLKEIYKNVWEISQKELIKMSAERAIFIDQSQSFNIFFKDVNFQKLHSAHFYGWELGLKTGMYYLRTKNSVTALKGLGIDVGETLQENAEGVACNLDDKDCLTCGA